MGAYTQATDSSDGMVALEKNIVFRKSAKGQEAFVSRQSGLAPRLRSLLILVDGKRPVAELAKLSSAAGDLEQLLVQLAADGLIEPVSGAKPAPGPAGNPAARQDFVATVRSDITATADVVITQPPHPLLTLPQARQLAVKRVTAILGPTGEDICLRIESAHSLAEYVAAVKRAYSVIREMRGGAVAAQFGDEIEANLPSA